MLSTDQATRSSLPVRSRWKLINDSDLILVAMCAVRMEGSFLMAQISLLFKNKTVDLEKRSKRLKRKSAQKKKRNQFCTLKLI